MGALAPRCDDQNQQSPEFPGAIFDSTVRCSKGDLGSGTNTGALGQEQIDASVTPIGLL